MEKEKIPLAHFQQWMQQLLLDPFQQTGVDPATLLPDAYHGLEDVIHDSEKLSAREHLGIYQRSYIARLRHCMSQQFSALEYALGADIFCAFADDYLASRPSYNYNLALLGKHFPEYLEANRPDKDETQKEDWIHFVIQLAQFEYDLGVIFEQKAEETYPLANIDAPEEKLRLVPICELFEFDFPVRKFYSDVKNGKEPDLPFEQKTYTVVLRHNYKLAVYDLHKEQFEFLKYVKESKTVGEAIIKFKENRPEEAVQFDGVWHTWKTKWIGVNLFRV